MKLITEVHVKISSEEWPSEEVMNLISEAIDEVDWEELVRNRIKDAGIPLKGLKIREME